MKENIHLKKVSESFTTQKEMNIQKKQMIKDICDFFGVTREQMRLQTGCITLQGNYNGQWQNITNRITDFPKWIKNKNWCEYRLKTHVTRINKDVN